MYIALYFFYLKQEPLTASKGVYQILLIKFTDIDYVIINHTYLRYLSLNRGQENLISLLLILSFIHTFIRQILH